MGGAYSYAVLQEYAWRTCVECVALRIECVAFFFSAAATEEKRPDVKAKVLSSPFRRGKVE